ncbi:hypothetical protein V1971_26390, partial [Pseudomonas aeruginosa]
RWPDGRGMPGQMSVDWVAGWRGIRNLPAAKKRVLELDYGMEEGQVKLPCRQAFLYYTLRRLGLHTKEAPDPLAQQITLRNRDEIQPYIDALTAQA